MSYILKAYLDVNCYFDSGIKAFLTNAHNFNIYLYDDTSTLINTDDTEYFKKRLLEGPYTFYGTHQGYSFQIRILQSSLDALFVTITLIEPFKVEQHNQSNPDLAWYARVFIKLCSYFVIIRLYVGIAEMFLDAEYFD